MVRPEEVNSLLPLPLASFYILTAIVRGERHGYAIILDIAKRSGGEMKLSAGTLYRSIQRMQEQGLILESRRRPAPDADDERRRYYEIAPLGSAVLRAEIRRLKNLIKLAPSSGLASEKA